METKNNEIKNCSSCMNFGSEGKRCTCKVNNRILNDIDKIPFWCPMGLNK